MIFLTVKWIHSKQPTNLENILKLQLSKHQANMMLGYPLTSSSYSPFHICLLYLHQYLCSYGETIHTAKKKTQLLFLWISSPSWFTT